MGGTLGGPSYTRARLGVFLERKRRVDDNDQSRNFPFSFQLLSIFTRCVSTLVSSLGRAFSSSSLAIPAATRSEWEEFFCEGIFSVVLTAFAEEARAEADGRDEGERDLVRAMVQDLGELTFLSFSTKLHPFHF